MSSAGTPWSVLNVEGSDDISDEELLGDDDSADPGSILSPASKRAKKRQAAARNKRAKQEAKQQAEQPSVKSIPGLQAKTPVSKPAPKASSLQQAAVKTNGAASSEKGLPAPPTFVSDGASANGRLAVDHAVSASSSAGPRLGDPFLQASNQASTSAAATPSAQANYAASAATDTETEEEEDQSLLLDEDDESSSSSEGEEKDYGDISLQSREEDNLAEPPTPRPAPPKLSIDAAADKAASLQNGANSALNSVAKDSDMPTSVQNLAASAKEGDVLESENPAPAVAYGSDHDPSKKWKSVITRTVWTLVMIVGFAALMTMGHVYLIILVLFCQAAVFKEISALFDVAAKPIHTHHHHSHGKNGEKPISPSRAARDARVRAERERWSKVTSWYFFAATNYFLYGETVIYYFKHIVFVDAYFIPFARHHRFISFMLYVLGFVGFVTNLKRNQLRRQFGLFCWIHMSLLLIVVSSHFIVNNILEGIIWFWLPASLVVMNDIAAYVWGMLFGRTQLIKLSPKKTVEGFVGAAFTTIVFAYIWATIFMRYSYMICPATDLGTTAFSSVACEPNDVFNWRYFVLPSEVSRIISMVYPVEQIPWAPFQFHAVIMGIFASLVAPFGGFFASGFKRAFNVKDFGDSIPGHGGMTDRMDCQFLMGLFAYVYYSSIIRDNHVTVGGVMQTIVSSLNQQEQAELAKALAGYLTQQGIKWNK